MKKYKYTNKGYKPFIPDRLKSLIANYFDIEEKLIVPEASWKEDLCCDSLDCVEIVMMVEKEYGIMIPDDEAMKCYTVGNLVELIKDIEEGGRRN